MSWLPLKSLVTKTCRLAGIAAIAITLLCLASSVSAQSMPSYQAPAKPRPVDNIPVELKAQRGQAPLSKLYGHLKPDAAKAKRLRPLTEREKQQTSEKLLQIGVVRQLSSPLNPLTDGADYQVPEGDVRVASVVTEGALFTRIHFKGLSLPAGARVFVYSLSHPDEYYGPYEDHGPTEDGTFWTPPMRGDSIAIEYFTPKGTSAVVPFKISAVSHIYKDAFAVNDPAGFCEQEVQTAWSFVKSSVGLLQFTTGGFEAICTGTLMNNAANDQKPYLLTTNHCISTQTEAQTLRVYWDYNVGDFPSGFTTDGANLLATGTNSDFAFLFLTGTMPGGRFFSGWDASAFSGSATGNDIHHPNGSHKRQSTGNARQPTSGAECDLSGIPGLQCIAVDWTTGVTEGGSSGSPLWKGDPADPGGPQLVGTLTGGPSACGGADERDFFGRFSVTYPFIAQFLDNTACSTTLTPASQSFSAAGGGGSFSVTSACNWNAVSTAPFVTVTPPANGSGNGTVNFTVAANAGMQRSATIVVGSKAFVINQDAGGPCVPTSINFGETKNGTLAVGDCQLQDGSLADGYTFNGTAGQQISISMTSAQFDTFLWLYKPSGATLAADDDGAGDGSTNSRIPASGGFITLPVSGTYLIFANAFFPANQGGVGAYSLTLSARPRNTLTVASTPDSNVAITVTPADLNGNSDGSTQFTRTYYQNTTAVLNAPGIANGKEFKEWQKDGGSLGTSNVAIVNMDADHTLTAVYGPITTYNFTFMSSNPDSGVAISVNPNDNNGAGNGTTTFTRNYNRGSDVFFSAPQVAPNGNIFQKWQRDDGYSETSRFISTVAFANSTWTAFYLAPSTFTLTVSAQNPSDGIIVTVTPNDNGGLGGGTAPFTRTYQQLTSITLTAPATAPNGNYFDRWTTANGNSFDFNRTTTFSINSNMSLTAVYATTPAVWTETGTNIAAAINSVTFVRGPFQVLDPHNFSADGHTRIILFVSNLPGPDPSLGVAVPNFQLPIEAVGQLGNLPGLAGTTGVYVVCKLPDGLPTGALQLNVLYKGIVSQPVILNIIP